MDIMTLLGKLMGKGQSAPPMEDMPPPSPPPSTPFQPMEGPRPPQPMDDMPPVGPRPSPPSVAPRPPMQGPPSDLQMMMQKAQHQTAPELLELMKQYKEKAETTGMEYIDMIKNAKSLKDLKKRIGL